MEFLQRSQTSKNPIKDLTKKQDKLLAKLQDILPIDEEYQTVLKENNIKINTDFIDDPQDEVVQQIRQQHKIKRLKFNIDKLNMLLKQGLPELSVPRSRNLSLSNADNVSSAINFQLGEKLLKKVSVNELYKTPSPLRPNNKGSKVISQLNSRLLDEKKTYMTAVDISYRIPTRNQLVVNQMPSLPLMVPLEQIKDINRIEHLKQKNKDRMTRVKSNLEALEETQQQEFIKKIKQKQQKLNNVEQLYQEERKYCDQLKEDKQTKLEAIKQKRLEVQKKIERKAYIDYKKHIKEIKMNGSQGNLHSQKAQKGIEKLPSIDQEQDIEEQMIRINQKLEKGTLLSNIHRKEKIDLMKSHNDYVLAKKQNHETQTIKANSVVGRYHLPESVVEDVAKAELESKNMKDYVLLKKYKKSISKHEKRVTKDQEDLIKKNEEHFNHIREKQSAQKKLFIREKRAFHQKLTQQIQSNTEKAQSQKNFTSLSIHEQNAIRKQEQIENYNSQRELQKTKMLQVQQKHFQIEANYQFKKIHGSFSNERFEKHGSLPRNQHLKEVSRHLDMYNSSPQGKPYGLTTQSQYRNPAVNLDKE